jgi:hypothetical protein
MSGGAIKHLLNNKVVIKSFALTTTLNVIVCAANSQN